MLKVTLALFGLSIFLCVGQIAQASCDVKAKAPVDVWTFAATNTQDRWREYKNIAAVPELDTNGGKSAQFWRESEGRSSVYMVVPGEDFWTYTRYCFDAATKLSRVGFEVRTAWGWGYRLEGAIVGAALRPSSTQFFSVESGKTIPRPGEASDIPDALKPDLYLRLAKLPFAQLLSRHSAATQQ